MGDSLLSGAAWAKTEYSKRLSGRRSRDTKPELEIRRRLRALGVGGYRVHRKVAGYTADIVFPGPGVAVHVDGCFWHGCPQHYRAPGPGPNSGRWAEKVERNRERDARADELARAAGWTVVRVWEHEDPGQAADRIRWEVSNARAVRRSRGARRSGPRTSRPRSGCS